MSEIKEYALTTCDMPNQEIFAAGTWNGDTYDVNDLDRMVEAYQATAETYKPKLKLTHEHPKGWPAVGWMENMRRIGSKLFADFRGIPRQVFESIQAKGFDGKSAEILWNPVVGGKKFPYLLKAVALLGVDMPAVDSISSLMSTLYSSEGGEAKAYKSEAPEGESKMYDLKEESQMDKLEQLTSDLAVTKEKLAAAERQYSAADEQVKKFSGENETLKKQVQDLTKRAEVAEGKNKEYSEKELTARITKTVDDLISGKKMAPANKEKAYNLLRAIVENGQEKKYKAGDKEMSLEEIAVDLLGSGSVGLNDKTNSYAGHRQTTDEDKDGEVINANLAEKAKDYAKQHNISFKESLSIVAREEGIDPSLRN